MLCVAIAETPAGYASKRYWVDVLELFLAHHGLTQSRL